MLAGPASELIARAPEIGAAFAEKLHIFDRPLAALSELQAALGINASDKAFDFNPSSLITGLLTIVTPAALQFVLAGHDCFSRRCSSSSWAAPAFAITP